MLVDEPRQGKTAYEGFHPVRLLCCFVFIDIETVILWRAGCINTCY